MSLTKSAEKQEALFSGILFLINMKALYLIILSTILCSCQNKESETTEYIQASVKTTDLLLNKTGTYLIVLGNVQDAGSPQIACTKKCCQDLFENPDKNRKVVSLGLVDIENHSNFLFEATPDMVEQVKILKNQGKNASEIPDAIFITHAHIGHYSGLMYLGKEAMNADKTLVYTMPRMKKFLKNNGPWSQLVLNENISLQALNNEQDLDLSPGIKVTPYTVPHRDEFSETVGYTIAGPAKKALFIPDIDKWEKWDRDIINEIKKVDYAFIDATFYDGEEVNNRDISQIPHPFVIESMDKFSKLSAKEKNKIIFIHFNHTNPLLNTDSPQTKQVLKNGYRIARMNDIYPL